MAERIERGSPVVAAAAAVVSAVILAASSAWGTSSRGGVELEIETGEPLVRTIAGGETRVVLEGAARSAVTGEPDLPSLTVRIAVPPGALADSIRAEVRPLEVERISVEKEVRPAPPAAYIGSGELYWGPRAELLRDGRDFRIYESDDLFPASWGFAPATLGGLRRYRFATVTVHPVRYRPASGELLYASELRVKVTYEKEPRLPTALDADCGAEDLASRLLVNHEQARRWYPERCMGPPVTPSGLAIITTEDLETRSELLDDYIGLRESQGWEVTVATEQDWDVSTGEQLDDRADRIRAWLKERYVEMDLGFALLIGNPDPGGQVNNNIPMKPCSQNNYGTRGPTDFYYADLSGTWDSSENGVVCEFVFDSLDLIGEGAIDFVPEIYVGRIPCYSDGAAAVDDILARIIAYEEESVSGGFDWRRRMLLPDSIYFFDGQYGRPEYRRWDGATVGEWFIREQLGPRGMEWTALYEKEGKNASNFDCHFPLDTPTLVDQWARGYGLVFWTGHGSNSGVYRMVWNEDSNENEMADYNELSSPEFMSTGYLFMLESAPPPFVIHGSCSNGYPESSTNLGYSMLRRGSIGTVSASREAMTWHYPSASPEQWDKPEIWDGDVIDIVTEYSVNLLDGMEAGRALGEAIALTTDAKGDDSWYQKSIQNLYGDPLVRLVMCTEDADCDNGIFCDGEEWCDSGSCRGGEPAVCEPTDWCDQWSCDEEADECVPSPECGDPPVPDGGSGESAATVTGAGAGCSAAPRGEGRGSSIRLVELALGLI